MAVTQPKLAARRKMKTGWQLAIDRMISVRQGYGRLPAAAREANPTAMRRQHAFVSRFIHLKGWE
jgi:hypothetical protein